MSRDLKALASLFITTLPLLSSCQGIDESASRQETLDRYVMLEELTEESRIAYAQKKSEQRAAQNGGTRPILPSGEATVLVDEPELAPTGPSRPFAADPLDAAGLYPKE